MDAVDARRVIAQAVMAARVANRGIRAGSHSEAWVYGATRFIDGLSRALEATGQPRAALIVLGVGNSILRCEEATKRKLEIPA